MPPGGRPAAGSRRTTRPAVEASAADLQRLYRPAPLPAAMSAAIVTGSSRGIGRAIARRFAADGHDVVVNYVESAQRAETVATAIREETGADAVAVGADVADPDAAADLVDACVEAFGGVDHVVNNAGIDQHVHTENLDPADFRWVVETNLDGAFNVTKAALPHLRDSSARPTPSVTNVSSILAHTGAAVECHYAASKAGVLGLTKSHAEDFAPGIRVNAVAPGYVETEMTADALDEHREEALEDIPAGFIGEPQDIAHAVAYLRDARYVTGETLNVNGGELMR
jgi:NAD(P)-dependent dehydrogenase (short-subunit alcohol dehydrogenase family)